MFKTFGVLTVLAPRNYASKRFAATLPIETGSGLTIVTATGSCGNKHYLTRHGNIDLALGVST